jgi:tripartite-type tricarboxylate transporter receptor subunit TctC
MGASRCFAAAVALSTLVAAGAARADDAAMTMYIGTSAGGGHDAYGRALAAVLPRHLPGAPVVTARNMPAGDGMALANLVNASAPRDGSVLAISPAELYLPQVLSPGKFGFDVRKFGWIGTVATQSEAMGVFKTTGVRTIDDARRTEVVMGAVGPLGTASVYPKLANAFLGTRFKVIHGYPGGSEVFLAMDHGEVQGRVNQWSSWVSQRSNWLEEGRIDFLLQYGPKVLDGVPFFVDLVDDPRRKAIVEFVDLIQLVGRSFYTTPGLAPARLAQLRAAFDETTRDPEFVERIKKARLEFAPRPGAQLQADFDRVLGEAAALGPDIKAVLDAE